VFLFFWTGRWLPGYAHFPLLKRAGKRIVSLFVGDDVRWRPAHRQECDVLGHETVPLTEATRYVESSSVDEKLCVLRHAERYSDLILSVPSQAQLALRPYMHFYPPVNLSRLVEQIPGRVVPRVVHAPSDRAIKGTAVIQETVRKLQAEGVALEFRLLERMNNREGVKALTDADILFDQFGFAAARLAIEGLASGCVVLGGNKPSYAPLPPGSPVLDVSRDSLLSVLRQAVIDRDFRVRHAALGRRWVAEHFDHVAVSRRLLDWLYQGVQRHDYYPTFAQRYVPADDAERRALARWRRYVSGCAWYRERWGGDGMRPRTGTK